MYRQQCQWGQRRFGKCYRTDQLLSQSATVIVPIIGRKTHQVAQGEGREQNQERAASERGNYKNISILGKNGGFILYKLKKGFRFYHRFIKQIIIKKFDAFAK